METFMIFSDLRAGRAPWRRLLQLGLGHQILRLQALGRSNPARPSSTISTRLGSFGAVRAWRHHEPWRLPPRPRWSLLRWAQAVSGLRSGSSRLWNRLKGCVDGGFG